MVVPLLNVEPPKYDWEAELGDVPRVKASGVNLRTHPVSLAMRAGGTWRKRALAVLETALRLSEGRVPVFAAVLGLHYNTAFRMLSDAGLNELAGQLRFENKHAGPTGLGIQRRKPRAK